MTGAFVHIEGSLGFVLFDGVLHIRLLIGQGRQGVPNARERLERERRDRRARVRP